MAWVSCYDGVPCAFDAHGKRVLYTASGAWAQPPQPPTHVHYGGPPGDAAHERLTREELEERLGFTLNASLVVSQPELLRSLPMLNLHPDCLPPELVVSSERQEAISAAVRAGYVSSDVFVAPDAYGGCGLFAAAELPPNALVLNPRPDRAPSPDPSPEPEPRALSPSPRLRLSSNLIPAPTKSPSTNALTVARCLVQVGEYVGTVRRGAEADCGSDPYTMRYPDASGELSLSAKDGGSLMRFVNHAPAGSAAHNCDVRRRVARTTARTLHTPHGPDCGCTSGCRW